MSNGSLTYFYDLIFCRITGKSASCIMQKSQEGHCVEAEADKWGAA
jgi:hypothetical protein